MGKDRLLKCEFCGKVVQEVDPVYLREHPLAANAWFDQLLTEHYEVCESLDEGHQAGFGSGILE